MLSDYLFSKKKSDQVGIKLNNCLGNEHKSSRAQTTLENNFWLIQAIYHFLPHANLLS